MPDFQIYYQEGNSPGPFDIYLSGSSGLQLYASGVTESQLNGGYFITLPSGFTSSSIVVVNMSFGCATQDIVPFPTPTVSITPSISITPSRTPSISVTPSVTATPSATPTVTPSVTPPPSNTPSITPSVTPSQTPLISLSPTPSISITRTPSVTPPVSNVLYMGTTTNSYTAAYLACAGFAMNRAYYTLPYTGLGVGSVLYDNSNLTIPFPGNGNWIAVSYLGTGPIVAIRVNNFGVILDKVSC